MSELADGKANRATAAATVHSEASPPTRASTSFAATRVAAAKQISRSLKAWRSDKDDAPAPQADSGAETASEHTDEHASDEAEAPKTISASVARKKLHRSFWRRPDPLDAAKTTLAARMSVVKLRIREKLREHPAVAGSEGSEKVAAITSAKLTATAAVLAAEKPLASSGRASAALNDDQRQTLVDWYEAQIRTWGNEAYQEEIAAVQGMESVSSTGVAGQRGWDQGRGSRR